MPPVLTPLLHHLLTEQDNVVALWQLPATQKRAAIRAAALAQWRRLTRHTFLAAPSPPSEGQRLWAAVLHCGPRARLSGRAALSLGGWQQEAGAPFDVVVPHGVKPLPGPDWLRIHRTRHQITGPAATPRRTAAHVAAVHAAAWARSDREAMFVVISVLQQRLTSPDHLARAAHRQLPRRTLILELIQEYREGAQSLNELDFGALCSRFGVPPPTRQRRITDARGHLRAIDVEFTTRARRTLHVEIEGMHHLDPLQYMADVDRHNNLALAADATRLRITTWHVRHHPEPFMTALRGALAAS